MSAPQGVIAVFSTPKGEVTAYAGSFDLDSPGGFTRREAQESRARMRLGREVAKAYCAPDFADSISEYQMENIMRQMREKGFRVTMCPIGYDNAEGESQ